MCPICGRFICGHSDADKREAVYGPLESRSNMVLTLELLAAADALSASVEKLEKSPGGSDEGSLADAWPEIQSALDAYRKLRAV